MFFLPNTTSFAWSALMPVWKWQADEPPPEPLQDAVQGGCDEVPAASPVAPTGRWAVAGWRHMPSYSLLRNVAAERVAEQPSGEDLERTLATARQRRHPGCGQP